MKKISNGLDAKEIVLTIYNGGFGAIKETRKVDLTGEETELIFADVAQLIEIDSLLVDGLNIIEFNYDYDLVDRDKLLNKYIDKEVILKNNKTGDRKRCRLLSVESGARCVLEDISTKEIYIDSNDEIVLPALPSGLIVKPALVWKIGSSKSEDVKVSYLSKGFNWNANYVIELLDKALNIVGWAEIENQSGTTFENAKLKLIAGDVNRIKDDEGEYIVKINECYNADFQVEEKAFFDYHMYTIKNLTTLKDSQTKQISILDGSDIPYKKYYKLEKHEKKANVIIEFSNKKECGLGIAMPKGKLKIYKVDDADNSLEFIGEDQIDHKSKDEEITLNIGKAFDITYDFKEIDHRKTNGYEYHKYNYSIKNHKDEDAEVHFEHYIWGVWNMVKSTHDYIKKDSGTIEFIANVPSDSEAKIEFEFRVDRRIEVSIK